jgi:TolA-binding protein
MFSRCSLKYVRRILPSARLWALTGAGDLPSQVTRVAAMACLLSALFAPVCGAGSEEKTKDERRLEALSSIGVDLEWIRRMPLAERPAALEEAERTMEQLLSAGVPSGKRSAALYLSGDIRYALGDYQRAEEDFKKAEKADGRDVHADDAAFAYVTSLEAQGRDEEAAKEWDRWEKKYDTSPLLPEAMLARSWNAIRRDTLSVASETMDALLERFPFMAQDPRVVLASACLAYLEDRPDVALALLNNDAGGSAVFAGVDAPSIYLRALCHLEIGEKLKAAAEFQEVVEVHEESPLRDQAMLAKADIFLASRAYRSATEEFGRVAERASAPEVRAEAELRRAAATVLDGDTDGGIDLLREAVASHPRSTVAARAQYLLGEVLMAQSRYEDAILEFNRVLTDYFEHSLAASAQYRVGRCLDALDRQAEATSSYQAVVSGYPLSPESPAAAYLAGVGLLAQELPLAAAPYFQLVLDRYARDDTQGSLVFASPEHQELVEAALCLLELSYHRAGNLGQLSGAPHLMLKKMPPSKSTWRAYAMLIDADALAAQARYDDAQETLSQLISEFPEHRVGISANRLLAWTYAQQGRDDLAMESEARMLSQYSSYGDVEDMSSAYINKAHILFNQKKYEQAVSTYEEFAQRFPGHPKRQLALYQAGLCYVRLDRGGNAVDRWEEVVQSDPASEVAERAWVRAGDLYFQTEHYAEAKRCYQGLLDNFANTRVAGMATLRLAQCEYNAGNDQEALQRFSEVLERFPDSHVAASAEHGIEQSLYRLGQREDGSEVLAELVERYPTSPFAADAQFEIATRLYKSERFEEAAEAFRRVVSQFPGFAAADRAHFLMAEAYGKTGSSDKARLCYEQFLMFFPKSELVSTVRFRLGSLRFVEGDYMQAAVDFTGVLSTETSEEIASASLYNLALCRRMLGEAEEARSLLERYRQEHPDGDERDADVCYQIGDIHDKAGRTKLAVEEFTRALAAKPRANLAVEIYYRLGASREQLGEDDLAIEAYRKAMAAKLKTDAFRVSALVRCAALYEKKGNYDKALSAYRDLIQNAEDPELLVAARERVSELEAIGE